MLRNCISKPDFCHLRETFLRLSIVQTHDCPGDDFFAVFGLAYPPFRVKGADGSDEFYGTTFIPKDAKGQVLLAERIPP
jgi:hypothetical protein